MLNLSVFWILLVLLAVTVAGIGLVSLFIIFDVSFRLLQKRKNDDDDDLSH